MVLMLFLAAEKNRGKKNDFEYYVCWGLVPVLCLLPLRRRYMTTLTLENLKEAKKKKKRKKERKKKEYVVINFHLNLKIADSLKASSQAN